MRETGDLTYLQLASRAARASLAALPAEQNTGGLIALAQVEYATHDFVAARDHARRLVDLEPGKAPPLQLLGDALLELGEYAQADDAFRRMRRLGGIQGLTRVASAERLARWAALHGDTDGARRRLDRALATALALPVPPREPVAWCRWQLGEMAFSTGDYAGAERSYRDSLATFPDYFRALASLGRVRAARGDLAGAIEQYERVVRLKPDPTFVAALGDLVSRQRTRSGGGRGVCTRRADRTARRRRRRALRPTAGALPRRPRPAHRGGLCQRGEGIRNPSR